MRFIKNAIKKALAHFGYDIYATPKALIEHRSSRLDANLDLVFSHYFLRKKDFFFVQIGACDGLFADPFYKYIAANDLKGILVEPQKDMFAALQRNHGGNKNLLFLNLAIAEQEGLKKFYRVKTIYLDILPHGRGLSSLKKESIKRAVEIYLREHPQPRGSLPLVDEVIECEEVKCSTLQSVLRDHNVKSLDMLLIDTEGYDFEIIKTIDFLKVRPAIMQFEHSHLSTSDTNRCYDLLIRHGYLLSRCTSDTVAYAQEQLTLPAGATTGASSLLGKRA